MAFDVAQFRSRMVGDGARPNLFDCTITFPPSMINLGITSQISFMARSSQLPGSSINAVPMMYFGRELKFAGNRTFQDWTVTIINDEDFAIRRQFELWHSYMNSHISNLRSQSFAGPIDYTADGFVNQYGKTGDILKNYRFVGMFPVDISTIELDWSSNDTIEEFAVTFTYQWWESDTTEPFVVPA
jgi:hypothetical protein